MAATDIRQFLYYFKYLWGPTDFQQMQLWLQSEYRGLAEGAFGAAILQGLNVTPQSGMTVNIEGGIAAAADGRLIVVEATTKTLATPVGNPAKSLIVARPKLVDQTVIPEPANPANNVFLHQKFDHDILVLDGTPAPNPVYPSTQANDVVLMGFLLTAGQSTITLASLDRGTVSTPRKRTCPVRLVTGGGSYEVLTTDQHIDMDLSSASGAVLLPAASVVPGQDFTFVKIDSSANPLAVSGADLISGQNSWLLEDQWSTLTVRSVGTEWRVI